MQTIDIQNLTHAQTREPPAKVSYFLRKDLKGNSTLSEGDKKEIINYMLAKVFCVSQKVDSKHHLAREYL